MVLKNAQFCLLLSNITCSLLSYRQKSALLTCFDCSDQPTAPDYFDSKMLDSSAVVHFLSTSAAKTFAGMPAKFFLPFIFNQMQTYVPCSIKEMTCSIKKMTRIHRGSGLRTKVSEQTKLPRNWSYFLKDATNKIELDRTYNEIMSAADIPGDKVMFITSDSDVSNLQRH